MASPVIELKRTLGLRDVVLLNIAAVVSLRWLPVAAQTGPSSVVLWLLAFLFFFLPSSLTVLELSTRYPEEGGIYVWTRRALGDSHGFICAWCYWVNNLFYFPSLLIATAGITLYVAGTSLLGLGDSKAYMALFSLVLLWLSVWVNVRGLETGKWVQNVGAVCNWLPAVLVTVLGIVALVRHGSATRFGGTAMLPAFLRPGIGATERLGNVNFWATMCFAFAGIELASTMSGEIRDPRRTIARAILLSGVTITLIYIVGTVALLLALPAAELNLIGGVPQAAAQLGTRLGVPGLGPFVALLLLFGGMGTLTAWFAGAARILFVAGLDRALPAVLGRLHPRHGTPHVTMIIQGTVSTLILLMSTIGKGTSVGNIYLVLVDMSLIIYFLPFLYLFLSLIILRLRLREPMATEGTVLIRGGRAGALVCGAVGFCSTLLAIVLSTLPPDEVTRQGTTRVLLWTMSAAALFRMKVLGGCLVFVAAGVVLRLRAFFSGSGIPD